MNLLLKIIICVALCAGLGFLSGFSTSTEINGWFATIDKPSWNPPNWIFAPVWTLLYVLIAIAGWRSWMLQLTQAPFRLWVLQLLLNFAWSPAFFGLQDPTSAMIIILGLLVAVAGFILASWRQDRIAALLFLPYLAWVLFATALNAAILMLN